MNPDPTSTTDSYRQPGAIVRFDALAACDGTGLIIHNASALVQFNGNGPSVKLLALDIWHEIDAHPAAKHAQRVRLHNSVLIPGMVNAHTHLDLTHIGPQPHDSTQGHGAFVRWIDMIRTCRHADPTEIAASVRQGIALSLAAGVVAVGDIAGAPKGFPTLTPYETLAASHLQGVSFLEFFAIGTGRARGRERIESILATPRSPNPNVKLGLQPHAPNTVDARDYRWAAELADRTNLPLSTHLAETPEEHQFIAEAKGPQRELLERLGVWDNSILEEIGHGRTPTRHLQEALSIARFAAAHVNDADDIALNILAQTQTSVIYCPRASEYFGAATHFGPHRYQEMIDAGINVALGTDSIVNLPSSNSDRAIEVGSSPVPSRSVPPTSMPTSPTNPSPLLSTLEEARLLHTRDNTNPLQLLRMLTLNGAAALQLNPTAFQFLPNQQLAGLVAIQVDSVQPTQHPFTACLRSPHPLRLL